MATNFQPIRHERLTSSDIDLPPDEKRKLPGPTVLSEIYKCEEFFCLDIKDHRDKHMTLMAKSLPRLRKMLNYFKGYPREKIEELFPTKILSWRRIFGTVCKTCGDICRKHATLERFGCAKCGTWVPFMGDAFVKQEKKPAEKKSAKKPKKVVEEKPADPPKPMSRLMERMKQNKEKP